MIYTHAAAALLGASIAAVGAYKVQDWRYTGQINQIRAAQAEAVNTATREARAQESARFKGVQDAQAAAQTRAQVARRDADRARGELDRMRDAIAARPVCVPGDTASAGPQRTDATGDLLMECGAAFTELAGKADRLHADRMILLDAWPR